MKSKLWIPPANGQHFKNAAEKHNAIANEYEPQYNTLYWKLYDAITWDHMSNYVLSLAKGKSLLDVGGGTGKWARKFAKNGFSVEVVDPADNMRKVGQEKALEEKLDKKVKFHYGDVVNIPFGNELFDAVICQGNPVSYCSDPYKAISELARCAKKGAPIVISVHNKLAMIQYFCFYMGKISIDQAIGLSESSDVVIDYPIKAFTPDELREQCELNGLKVVSLIGKQCISGFAQTPHYLSMLENDESFEKVLNLEKTYWSDKSIIGLSGHLEVACIKV